MLPQQLADDSTSTSSWTPGDRRIDPEKATPLTMIEQDLWNKDYLWASNISAS